MRELLGRDQALGVGDAVPRDDAQVGGRDRVRREEGELEEGELGVQTMQQADPRRSLTRGSRHLTVRSCERTRGGMLGLYPVAWVQRQDDL